ncbi:lysophospholipase [Dactylosporangium roseum]|uniref:Lysophospholipase n=1 Tax=Dactylosporangium roseum TaxID=47989 RepID=A0ABY5YW88_9ACTN|nr:alpha/beta hydrolase [Dactylosporangium roseum]UWZ33664.1 lysophospholipase [Dactylosporangium roseum]
MQRDEFKLTGGGGATIVYDVWTPGGEPAGAVVLSHGMGEHARRYDHVVARLGGLGLVVYAPDHRGHGRSSGQRLLARRIAEYTADLDVLFGEVARRHPGRAPFLIGHSMGAMIALAYALDHQDRLRGLVLSGTPVLPGKGIPKPAIAVAKMLGRIAPGAPVQSLPSRYISKDPDVVARYDADPLVHHGKIPAGLGGAMLTQMALFQRRLPELTLPTLVLHGAEDRLVDAESSRLIAARAGSADLTLHVYEGLHHEVYNEPERERVLDDLVGWLNAH